MATRANTAAAAVLAPETAEKAAADKRAADAARRAFAESMVNQAGQPGAAADRGATAGSGDRGYGARVASAMSMSDCVQGWDCRSTVCFQMAKLLRGVSRSPSAPL